MRFDAVVVGAGIAGVTAAERLAQRGEKVLIIEKRRHIGGNSYDCYDDSGVLIHPYGPHIFHTNDRQVWDYLSRFTDWLEYEHAVLAAIDGRLTPVPFNLNSVEMHFDPDRAGMLKEKLVTAYGAGSRVAILEMLKSQDSNVRELARFVYDKVFVNYTAKQWGKSPQEIDAGVTARVPVLISRDNRYFQDSFQGMPAAGYTRMLEKMLARPNIMLLLGCDYKQVISDIEYDRLVYTGPLDYFFDYRYGRLPYRSIRFEFETLDQAEYQPVAVVNYPNEHAFTRITEFKHLTGQTLARTTILREYPENFVEGRNEPAYPVNSPETERMVEDYRKAAADLENTVFLGRLAEYSYYNMDQVVARVLTAIG